MNADNHASLTLSRHHRALSMLAEAIVGWPVSLEPCDGPAVSLSPLDPFTDQIEVSVDMLDETEHGRRHHRTLVTIQCVALRSRGSLDAALRHRLAAEHAQLPMVLSILEEFRIEALAARVFPGVRSDLERARRLSEPTVFEQDRGCNAAALWRFARSEPSFEGEHVSGAASLGHAGADLDVREALRVLRAPAADLADSIQRARAVCRHFDADGYLAAGHVTDPESHPPPSDESVFGASAGESRSIGRTTRGSAAGGNPLSSDNDMSEVSEGVDDDRQPDPAFEPIPTNAGGVAADRPRSFVYDEWDFRTGQHRPSWCRVVERRVVSSEASRVDEVRSRHAATRALIRRRLEELRVRRMARTPRSADGDELDLDAIIEARADARGAAPTSDRFHLRRHPLRRDVVTTFLVDLSASTSSPVEAPAPAASQNIDDDDPLAPLWVLPPEPVAPPRRVIDVAVDAVMLMGDALDQLGDRHAIYGFSGSGRDDVDFVVAKDIDDRVSPATWQAVSSMKPMRYTRMGAAIRHATAKLARHRSASRLLIIVSDGYPQDVDYGDDPRDRDYGLHDTARALVDAQSAGIETFCVTIDPAGHDYLRSMCPGERYLVIDEVESLPAELAKVWLAMRSR